ncbi:hypothetical protein IAT38_003644 [Cryptococcus sp. DSM 104549]
MDPSPTASPTPPPSTLLPTLPIPILDKTPATPPLATTSPTNPAVPASNLWWGTDSTPRGSRVSGQSSGERGSDGQADAVSIAHGEKARWVLEEGGKYPVPPGSKDTLDAILFYNNASRRMGYPQTPVPGLATDESLSSGWEHRRLLDYESLAALVEDKPGRSLLWHVLPDILSACGATIPSYSTYLESLAGAPDIDHGKLIMETHHPDYTVIRVHTHYVKTKWTWSQRRLPEENIVVTFNTFEDPMRRSDYELLRDRLFNEKNGEPKWVVLDAGLFGLTILHHMIGRELKFLVEAFKFISYWEATVAEDFRHMIILLSEFSRYSSSLTDIIAHLRAINAQEAQLVAKGLPTELWSSKFVGEAKVTLAASKMRLDEAAVMGKDLMQRCQRLQDLTTTMMDMHANDSMERLAIVTILFLPITFVATFFSMSFAEIEENTRPISYFWKLSIPLTVLFVILFASSNIARAYTALTRLQLRVRARWVWWQPDPSEPPFKWLPEVAQTVVGWTWPKAKRKVWDEIRKEGKRGVDGNEGEGDVGMGPGLPGDTYMGRGVDWDEMVEGSRDGVK